jgi:hypothetical protein
MLRALGPLVARARFLSLVRGGAQLGLDAFGQVPAARLAIPFLELLRRNLALDKQLREFASLRLALERHCFSRRVPVDQRRLGQLTTGLRCLPAMRRPERLT